MAWYWIILIVIGYLILWSITAVIFSKNTTLDDGSVIMLGLLLPVTLPIAIVLLLYRKLLEKFY